MITGEQFQDQLRQAFDAVMHDAGEKPSMCVVLHEDVDLGRTRLPEEEIEQMKERIREGAGPDAEAILESLEANDDIDLTEEHRSLHEALDAMAMTSAALGIRGSNLGAVFLSVGIRLGRMQAEQFLSQPIEAIDTGLGLLDPASPDDVPDPDYPSYENERPEGPSDTADPGQEFDAR